MNCPQLICGSLFGISVPHNDAWRLWYTDETDLVVVGRCECDGAAVATVFEYHRSWGVGDDDRSGVFMALLDAVELGVVRREDADDDDDDDMEESWW